MTQNTIGGKPLRQKAGMRRASIQDGPEGRHRIGVFAAFGAVAVGALVLAGAVTGSLWSEAGLDRAEAARQTEPEISTVAQTAAVEKAAAAETKVPAEVPVEEALSPTKPDVIKVEATRVADGKADSLSPDERIDRAVARITAGSTDEDVKKAITVAAREKAGEAGRRGDTVITAALPDSAAYAPARERAGSSALGAIRDFDKSDGPETAAIEPQPEPKAEPRSEKARPASESKAKTAAAAPTGPLGPAVVSTDVHMRSGMDNSSAVVTTVPANAAVQASQSCKSWCEVVYNGHHGYIYKSFVRHGAKPAATASAATTSTEAASSGRTVAAADQKTAETEAAAGILAQRGDPAALAEAAQRAQQRRR